MAKSFDFYGSKANRSDDAATAYATAAIDTTAIAYAAAAIIWMTL